jgi:hypothetical protein
MGTRAIHFDRLRFTVRARGFLSEMDTVAIA